MGVSRKSAPWALKPADFFTESDTARALFARLLDATSEDIAILPSVSYGMAVAGANLPIDPGSDIVVLDQQFPSNVYTWCELAAEKDARIITVRRNAGESWTQAVVRNISTTTALVAVGNVHWADGALLDLEGIAQSCRAHKAELVLDLTQSLGALPFSISAVQPAFAVSAGYKWLLGPYGMAFMYVRPDYQAGRPIEHNWIARKDSQDFSGLVHYKDDFQPGACRYDVGERSNFALMPMSIAAMEQLLEWSVPQIHATLSDLTGELAGRAEELGLQVAPPDERAGHILGVRFPRGMPPGISESLAQHRVYVSIRGNAMRISPHLYNSGADVDKLTRVLRDFA